MREQVWFIVSKTDERRFATTRPPSGEWVEALKKEGYEVFRIEFEMPEWWDPSGALHAKIDPRPRCIRCLEKWVPPEGIDATVEPCPSCRKILARLDLSARVHARQKEGATELTREEVGQIISDVELKHGVSFR